MHVRLLHSASGQNLEGLSDQRLIGKPRIQVPQGRLLHAKADEGCSCPCGTRFRTENKNPGFHPGLLAAVPAGLGSVAVGIGRGNHPPRRETVCLWTAFTLRC
jgi:hypothetical protein